MNTPTAQKNTYIRLPVKYQSEAQIPVHITNTLADKISLPKHVHDRIAKQTRKRPSARTSKLALVTGLTVGKQKKDAVGDSDDDDSVENDENDGGLLFVEEQRRPVKGTVVALGSADGTDRNSNIEGDGHDGEILARPAGKSLFGFANSPLRTKIAGSNGSKSVKITTESPSALSKKNVGAIRSSSALQPSTPKSVRFASTDSGPANVGKGILLGTPSNKRLATELAKTGADRTAGQSAKRRRISRNLSRLQDVRSDDSDGQASEDDEESEEEVSESRVGGNGAIRKSPEGEEEDAQEDDEDEVEGENARENVVDGIDEDAHYERYFQNLHDSGIQTSNNTLSRLPTLDHKEFTEALARIQPKHLAETRLLSSLHAHQFPQWYFELNNNFSLLFYGYGSKQSLLMNFAREYLIDAPLFVINGYFPTINAKQFLAKILDDVIGYAGPAGTLQEQTSLIATYFSSPPAPSYEYSPGNRHHSKLYLLVHNIDGPSLRNEKTQSILSTLAAAPNIHLIASVDHINAPLLWDTVKSARFNWIWHDVTTFENYRVETTFENSIMVRRGDLGPRGIGFVLNSLTANALKMFRILAEYQISMDDGRNEGRDVENGNESGSNEDDDDEDDDVFKSKRRGADRRSKSSRGAADHYADIGLPYQRFFTLARERFLVNSDLAFQSQLTEFRDHKIIHSKRRTDGSEVFYIPLDAGTLDGVLRAATKG